MYIVIATASCKPESREEMVDVLSTLCRASRDDEGCLSYNFYSSIEDPNAFTSVEQWESAESAEAHMGTAHVAAAFERLPGLLASEPVITLHEVASSQPLG